MPQVHTIRRAIVVPLALALLSLCALLVISCLAPSLPGERIVVTTLTVIQAIFFGEVISRRVSLEDEGLEIYRFLRKKRLLWNEITHVGSLVLGAKIYVLLTTTRGFYILSNNYERFAELVRKIVENLDAERVDREIDGLLTQPHRYNKPVYSAWMAVAVITAVVALRLYTF